MLEINNPLKTYLDNLLYLTTHNTKLVKGRMSSTEKSALKETWRTLHSWSRFCASCWCILRTVTNVVTAHTCKQLIRMWCQAEGTESPEGDLTDTKPTARDRQPWHSGSRVMWLPLLFHIAKFRGFGCLSREHVFSLKLAVDFLSLHMFGYYT
jgi:hypothetical protein